MDVCIHTTQPILLLEKLKIDLEACESNMAVTLHNSSIHKMDTIAINLVLSNSFIVDGVYIICVFFSLTPYKCIGAFLWERPPVYCISFHLYIYIYILFLPIFYVLNFK